MSGYWLTLRDAVDPRWFSALERLAESLAADGRLPRIDPDDFMYAARVTREELPVLHVYRNAFTRKCLNVDEGLRLWRFVGGSELEGYRLIEKPAEALDRAEIARANLLAAHTRRASAAAPAGRGAHALTTETEGPDAEADGLEEDVELAPV